jgi:hypothetical protein
MCGLTKTHIKISNSLQENKKAVGYRRGRGEYYGRRGDLRPKMGMFWHAPRVWLP